MITTVPRVSSVWPLLDDESRAARRKLIQLAVAAVGGDQRATGDEYPADLDRLTKAALESPDEARRLLEAAATLIALAVGRGALDDTADFVREFDEVDFVTEADASNARSTRCCRIRRSSSARNRRSAVSRANCRDRQAPAEQPAGLRRHDEIAVERDPPGGDQPAAVGLDEAVGVGAGAVHDRGAVGLREDECHVGDRVHDASIAIDDPHVVHQVPRLLTACGAGGAGFTHERRYRFPPTDGGRPGTDTSSVASSAKTSAAAAMSPSS